MHAVQDQRAYRLSSIDMLRGLVIVVMALDHTRDYFMAGARLDVMSDPNVTPALYFTRWITHFCAPVFVFLAGTGAGLMAARKTRAALARFLVARGLWLLFIEWFVIATAISFAPLGIEQFQGRTFVLLQVLWAIGCSLIVLGACQFLGRRFCLVLGIAIVIGHNLLDAVWPSPQDFPGGDAPLWVALHAMMEKAVGPFFIVFAYPLPPWIGVLLLGFGASLLFERPPERRNAALLGWGVTLTAGFLVLRALDSYGDPNHWAMRADGTLRTVLDFLNTTKYPPSLQYLLMTLGPAAVLCAFADRMHGSLKNALVTFGRVPFAFYVAHFYLIHALSVLLGVLQGFPASELLTVFIFYPAGYGLPLPGAYAVWVLVIVLLYPLCRWVAAVKARSSAWWLSYL